MLYSSWSCNWQFDLALPASSATELAIWSTTRGFQQEALKQLQAIGRKAGLAGIEIITGVLADEEWTPKKCKPQPLSRNSMPEHEIQLYTWSNAFQCTSSKQLTKPRAFSNLWVDISLSETNYHATFSPRNQLPIFHYIKTTWYFDADVQWLLKIPIHSIS